MIRPFPPIHALATALLLACAVSWRPAVPSAADKPAVGPVTVVQSAPRPLNPDLARAQQLEQEGKTAEAIELYRRIYEDEGTDAPFWKLLILYEEAKRYDDMAALVSERLERTPDDPSLMLQLARARHGMGDDAGARDTLDAIVGDNWGDTGRVMLAAGELIGWKEYAAALAILERARKTAGNDDLFAPEMGRLRVLRAEYLLALDEYLKLTGLVPIYIEQSRRMIEEALKSGTDPGDIDRVLERHAKAHPEQTGAVEQYAARLKDTGRAAAAGDLIVRAAVAAGNPDIAWNWAVSLDRGSDAAAAAAVYDAFNRAFPADDRAVPALSAAADRYRAAGDTAVAVERYEALADRHADTAEGRMATLALFEMRAGGLSSGDYIEGLQTFVDRGSFRPVIRRARLLLGEALAREGDFTAADTALLGAYTDSRTPEERYEAAAEQARVALFAGDLDAMGRHIEACMGALSGGVETDDLLALRLLGLQCRAPAEHRRFETYVGGRYALFRGDRAAAADSFRTVAVDTASVAAPHAAAALAGLTLDGGDAREAVKWYLAAAAAAGDTTLRAGALLAAADILDRTDAVRARDLRREVLLTCPGTPHDPVARRRLTEEPEKSP